MHFISFFFIWASCSFLTWPYNVFICRVIASIYRRVCRGSVCWCCCLHFSVFYECFLNLFLLCVPLLHGIFQPSHSCYPCLLSIPSIFTHLFTSHYFFFFLLSADRLIILSFFLFSPDVTVHLILFAHLYSWNLTSKFASLFFFTCAF